MLIGKIVAVVVAGSFFVFKENYPIKANGLYNLPVKGITYLETVITLGSL
jgi:hypothetical protein